MPEQVASIAIHVPATMHVIVRDELRSITALKHPTARVELVSHEGDRDRVWVDAWDQAGELLDGTRAPSAVLRPSFGEALRDTDLHRTLDRWRRSIVLDEQVFVISAGPDGERTAFTWSGDEVGRIDNLATGADAGEGLAAKIARAAAAATR
jgi:hypothetical protein